MRPNRGGFDGDGSADELGTRGVTVLVPTYNRSGYLRVALESILRQDHPAMVVGVFDNGSTDDTADVVAAFDDPRVTYTRNDENIGFVANFNVAASSVSTPYFTFVHDDDELVDGALARAVAAFEAHPHVGLVHSAFDVIGEHGEVLTPRVDWTKGLVNDTIESGADFIRRSIVGLNRVCPSGSVVRTKAVSGDVYDPADYPVPDYTLWMRIALAWDVLYLADPMVRYRVHGATVTSDRAERTVDGYVLDNATIMRARQAKERFLDLHAAELREVDRLRRLARKGTRFDLVDAIRSTTIPERDRATTLRKLRAAARLDPALLLEPYAWRMLFASAIGPRPVSWLHAHGVMKERRAR